jgi:hypothetical protein
MPYTVLVMVSKDGFAMHDVHVNNYPLIFKI